ncbi:MAG: ATP-binding protein [Pseudomonadota bacterium]
MAVVLLSFSAGGKTSMSGKTYLFIAMAVLIGILAISQLLLMQWLSTRVSEEISEQSKALSQKVLTVALEELQQDNPQKKHSTIVIQTSDQKKASIQILNPSDINETLNSTRLSLEQLKQDTTTIENIKEQNSQTQDTLAKLLRSMSQVDSFLSLNNAIQQDQPNKSAEKTSSKSIEAPFTSEQVTLKKVKQAIEKAEIIKQQMQVKIEDAIKQTLIKEQEIEDRVNASIKQRLQDKVNAFKLNIMSNSDLLSSNQNSQDKYSLMNSILWWNIIIVVITSTIAVVIGYGISFYFNKPLESLSDGFSALGKGQLDVALTAKGTKEVKDVIHGFNAMVLQLRKHQDTLEQLQEKQHMAELGEIARATAHALRNPIHAIGLYMNKIASFTSHPQELENIYSKLQQMDKTIQALLTLHYVGIHRAQPLNLYHIVQDILLELSTQNRSVIFENNIDVSLKILGNEQEIRNILHTLIVNALEAHHSAGSVVPIVILDEVNTTIPNNNTAIAVSDQGEGLHPTIFEKLFQPHVTTKPDGIGMGLYMAKRLAKLYYDGDIILQNIPEGGCKAQFVFKKI